MRPRLGLLLAGCLLGLGRPGGEAVPAAGGGAAVEQPPPGGWRFPYPPDTRPNGCDDKQIHDGVSVSPPSDPSEFSSHTVSVVIPWLNETWQHLEGTLAALLHFTPDVLLEEVIFISDGNEDSKEEELMRLSSKVRVIALPSREGLIRAKMIGVDAAKAPVIVFLEAHCIVNRDWLPPLLTRVKANPHVLAMPFIDYISPADWSVYRKGGTGHWRYEWNFNLIYSNPGGFLRDTAEVIISPGTSGGIFAIRADWFRKLRLFDPGMQQWGGDHFELTMKVWRCGGRIEIVPCSRIGHVFRTPQERPYAVEILQVVRNYARLSRIWTQDHLEYFYKVKNEARSMTFLDMEPLREAHAELVRDLGCKDMTWYLENVDHEMHWEMDKICVPGAPNAWNGCSGPPIPGRATVDRVMPRQEFVAARVTAAVRRAREKRRNDSSGTVDQRRVEPRAVDLQFVRPTLDVEMNP